MHDEGFHQLKLYNNHIRRHHNQFSFQIDLSLHEDNQQVGDYHLQ